MPWAGPAGPAPAPCAGAVGPSVRGAGGAVRRGAPQRGPSTWGGAWAARPGPVRGMGQAAPAWYGGPPISIPYQYSLLVFPDKLIEYKEKTEMRETTGNPDLTGNL